MSEEEEGSGKPDRGLLGGMLPKPPTVALLTLSGPILLGRCSVITRYGALLSADCFAPGWRLYAASMVVQGSCVGHCRGVVGRGWGGALAGWGHTPRDSLATLASGCTGHREKEEQWHVSSAGPNVPDLPGGCFCLSLVSTRAH